MVWVEGKDLAGNKLQGPGTENSPRVPALEIMHFTPNLISIWVDNNVPEVGDIIQVDTRIHNIGNLPGNLNVSLWAWEPQPNTEPLIIEFESQEVSLDARQSILLRFEFEAWREGDLQLYLILNDDEDSRIPIDLAPVREEGASLSWVERVFGDGPIVVSILILLCTALGFGAAMLWLREEESDEWDEQLYDEQIPGQVLQNTSLMKNHPPCLKIYWMFTKRKNEQWKSSRVAQAGVPEWSKGADSRSAVKRFAGSNPAPCTN